MENVGFSREKHEETGRDLKKIYDSIMHTVVIVDKSYSRPISSVASTAEKAILDMRSALDDYACRELPKDKHAHELYFPVDSNLKTELVGVSREVFQKIEKLQELKARNLSGGKNGLSDFEIVALTQSLNLISHKLAWISIELGQTYCPDLKPFEISSAAAIAVRDLSVTLISDHSGNQVAA